MMFEPSSSSTESDDDIIEADNSFSYEVMLAVGADLVKNGGYRFEEDEEEIREGNEPLGQKGGGGDGRRAAASW